MSPREILLNRINAHTQALSDVEKSLSQAVTAYDRQPRSSRSAGRDCLLLKKDIEKRRDEFIQLKKTVVGNTDGPDRAASSNWWSRLGQYTRESNKLFAECLAYCAGPLTRGLKWHGDSLDRGACRIADELLEEFTVAADKVWSRRSLLSDSEYIGGPAQIIRLRFPVNGIWDLPVVAHEFGHLVGLDARYSDRIADCERVPSRDIRRINWLNEHFADLYATCVLGPAYACTCLLARFDPAADPRLSSDEHPSDDLRRHAIIWTLTKMGRGTHKPMADRLERTWNDCRSAATTEVVEIDGEDLARLNKWLPCLFELAKGACSAQTYQNWDWAEETGRLLANPAWGVPRLVLPNITIVDILNAAWSSRIKHGADTYAVGMANSNALKMCHRVIDRRPKIPP